MALSNEVFAVLDEDPRPGSTIVRIQEWIDERRDAGVPSAHIEGWAEVGNEIRDDAVKIGASGADHMRGLRRLMSAGDPLQSSIATLARSTIEAALQIAWLLDPKAQPRTLILRAMASRLDAIEGSERTARQFSADVVDIDRHIAAVDGVHKWMERSGFDRTPARDPRFTVNVGLDQERVNLKFNATEAISAYLLEVDQLWRILSGATHSKAWFNNSAYRFEDEDNEVASYDDTHAAATMGVLAACDAFTDAVCCYVGIDPEPQHRATHLSRRSILSAAGGQFSPMSWEDYRDTATSKKKKPIPSSLGG